MCLRPKTWWTKDGEAITIACQECRQCLDLKTHSWVGRNIAESKTSTAAHFITLTYGRDEFGNEDHPRAKVLTYSDVQKWLKLLRYHGYPCRYFLAGEYGTLKGRCHWHVIVHWLGRVPAFAGFDQHGRWSDNHISRHGNTIRFNHQRLGEDGKPALVRGEPAFWWPHGWTQVELGATVKSIKYVCKYIRKDIGNTGKQSHFMMSKQPPLGAEYFKRRAERYVAARLAPQAGPGYINGRLEYGAGGYSYSWSDVTKRNKKGGTDVLEFQLTGVSLDLFMGHYVATWATVWPGEAMPASKLIQEFMDPGAWQDRGGSDVPLRLVERVPVSDVEKQQALERVRAALRHGRERPAEFDADWARLRPEFEARARQIAFHRSEYARGTQRF